MTDDQKQMYEYLDNHFNKDVEGNDKSAFILINFSLHKEGVVSIQSNLGKKGAYIALKNIVQDFEG